MASPEGNIFQKGLGRADANFAPLTPLGFLSRAASIYPDRAAMVHGDRRIVYRDFDARARRLASALARPTHGGWPFPVARRIVRKARGPTGAG